MHTHVFPLSDPDGQLFCFVLVIYKFEGVPEHVVLVKPHGNAKRSGQYTRTKESTKQKLKDQLKTAAPKLAVDQVYESKGGILKATSGGDLPRGLQQAYDLKRANREELSVCPVYSSCGTRDMLFTVMQQCKTAEKGTVFVRDVTCAPEPMAVIATDQQLLDLERFCTNPYDFCVLGIDPTFKLGDFSVTPMVYRHLIVEDVRSHASPIMPGPMLVHQRKLFRSYNYFLSTLVGIKPTLAHVLAVGTDGEQNLVDALAHQFKSADHLRCIRHLQQNVEKHLHEKGFPQSAIKQYAHDIFGFTDKEGCYHEGLIDAFDAFEFDVHVGELKDEWNRRELDCLPSGSSTPQFFDWFLKNKAADLKECTLRALREKVGMGSPPKPFYTNDSESLNAVIKEKVDYKKQQWPIFNDKMKQLVDLSQREVEKAVIGTGRYQVKEQYRHLIVDQKKWFRMTEAQRARHLQKFNSITVTSTSPGHPLSILAKESTSQGGHTTAGYDDYSDITSGRYLRKTSLSVSLDEIASKSAVPNDALKGIWEKAASLASSSSAITFVPGGNELDKMVQSYGGTAPHLVKVRGASQADYVCDEKCPQFKSLHICAHTVAAAETNGALLKFVGVFLKRHGKKPANLTKLALHDMPSHPGKKKNERVRKRTPKRSPPNDENRIPFQVASSYSRSSPSEHELEFESTCEQGWMANTPQRLPQPPPLIHAACTPNQVFLQLPHSGPATGFSLGSVQNFTQSAAPPLLHVPIQQSSPSIHQTTPFKIFLLCGNISTCHGCLNEFLRTGPPYDLIVQHQEDRSYTSPVTGLQATKYGNAYYHPHLECIRRKWPAFIPDDLVIPANLGERLQDSHKQLLFENFGIIL